MLYLPINFYSTEFLQHLDEQRGTYSKESCPVDACPMLVRSSISRGSGFSSAGG